MDSQEDTYEFYSFFDENSEKGQKVEHVTRSKNQDETFPSLWFTNNENQKPKVVLYFKDCDWDKIRSKFAYKLIHGLLSVDEAVWFLIKFQKLYMSIDKARAGLESFKVKLWDQNAKIWPENLITIEQGESQSDFAGTQEEKLEKMTPTQIDVMIALNILTMYRLGHISRSNYRDTVEDRIKEIFHQHCGNFPTNYHANTSLYGHWKADQNFCKMIAAYDMFLHWAGTDSKYQFLRIGTLSSQYRDCSALIAFERIADIFDFTPRSKLSDWLFIRPVARSFLRFVKKGEELEKQYSYMQYARDFGLFQKSPYSANANSEFHIFIHVAGALMSEPWSKNAQIPSRKNIRKCALNGALMAFACQDGGELRKYFHSKEDRPKIETLDKKPKAALTLKACKNATQVYRFVANNGLSNEGPLKEFIIDNAKGIEQPREGTIGHYIVKHLT